MAMSPSAVICMTEIDSPKTRAAGKRPKRGEEAKKYCVRDAPRPWAAVMNSTMLRLDFPHLCGDLIKPLSVVPPRVA